MLGAGEVQCSSLTAAAEVGMALESEAVAAAVREAEYERVQREGAEAGVAALQDTLDKLKQKLKATQVSWDKLCSAWFAWWVELALVKIYSCSCMQSVQSVCISIAYSAHRISVVAGCVYTLSMCRFLARDLLTQS